MERIFYITRDVERAAGSLEVRDDVFAVTNMSPLAEAMARAYKDNIIMINDQRSGLSTLELLWDKTTREKVRSLSKIERPNILVFKSSPQIEKECEKIGWRLLNPSYEVGAVLEEKIGQWRWLSALRQAQGDNVLLPEAWVGKTLEQTYSDLVRELGDRPIVQFNRGHTGLGTFRLESEKQWKELQEKFPQREVKVSRFYKGKAYTVNAVVVKKPEAGSRKPEADSQSSGFLNLDTRFSVVIGHISEQLTGIPGCTNNPYATVGNDWSAGGQLLEDAKNNIHGCAEMIGTALAARGYRGMFGIDVIVPHVGANGRTPVPILIEVNPRQPASATMESQLQRERGELSVMEWHLDVLCHPEPSRRVTPNMLRQAQHDKIFHGFQLFFRNTEPQPVILGSEIIPGRYRLREKGLEFVASAASVHEAQEGELFAFSVGKNASINPGGEILRMQSKSGMIDTFGKDYKRAISAIRRPLIS